MEPHAAMAESPFTTRDHRQMAALGIAPEEARRHLELYRNPPPHTRVRHACTLGDGIRAIFPDDEAALAARFGDAATARRVHKLVPASGAATRLFKSLLEHLEQLESCQRGAGGPAPDAEVRTFFA